MSTELLARLGEENPVALTADGFEEALIGICRRFSQPPLAAYDYDECIGILMRRDGMSHDDAVEYFEFNVLGAWMGEGTPVFIEDPQRRQHMLAALEPSEPG